MSDTKDHDPREVEALAKEVCDKCRSVLTISGKAYTGPITDERLVARFILAREARLVEALLDMRWVQPSYNGSPSCAYCGEQKHLHTTPCGFDELLAAHRLAPQPSELTLAELALEACDILDSGSRNSALAERIRAALAREQQKGGGK